MGFIGVLQLRGFRDLKWYRDMFMYLKFRTLVWKKVHGFVLEISRTRVLRIP